jgi:lipopolysaccharide biosynthesis glycosyltransferase|tara:strand:- start:198 stop:977 length:780 start_codon:yes stop_codon:yes gene_type:complete
MKEPKKYVLALACDNNYVNEAKALIGSAIREGKWKYDICLIANNLEKEKIKEFTDIGVYVKDVDASEHSYHIKYHLFTEYFKKWEKVLYVDCDIMFSNDINFLMDFDGKIFCDGEANKVAVFFERDRNVEVFDNMASEYNVDKFGFNSGCMLFKTSLITSHTFDELHSLREKYISINHHTGIEGGGDQPILNLYFNDWIQFPQKVVSFWKKCDHTTRVFHFTRWFTPEKNPNYLPFSNHGIIQNIYNKNLKEFPNLKLW